MKFEVKNLHAKTLRTTGILIDDKYAVIIKQRSTTNKETDSVVWFTPTLTVKETALTSAEHADLMKDAIAMAAELIEEWSADTGKEIT